MRKERLQIDQHAENREIEDVILNQTARELQLVAEEKIRPPEYPLLAEVAKIDLSPLVLLQGGLGTVGSAGQTEAREIHTPVGQSRSNSHVWDFFDRQKTAGKPVSGIDRVLRWRSITDVVPDLVLARMVGDAIAITVDPTRIVKDKSGAGIDAGLWFYSEIVRRAAELGLKVQIGFSHRAGPLHPAWHEDGAAEYWISCFNTLMLHLAQGKLLQHIEAVKTLVEPFNDFIASYVAGVFYPYKILSIRDWKKWVANKVVFHRQASALTQKTWEAAGLPAPRMIVTHGVVPVYRDRLPVLDDGIVWFWNTVWGKKVLQHFADGETTIGIDSYGDCPLGFMSIPYYFLRDGGQIPFDFLASLHPINPGALVESIRQMQQNFPGNPITVAEAGLGEPAAWDREKVRGRYLLETLRRLCDFVSECSASHLPIPYAFHTWTGIDNCEWRDGDGRRYGLVRIEDDGRLRLNPSFWLMKHVYDRMRECRRQPPVRDLV